MGQQIIGGAVPVFGEAQRQLIVGEEIRDGRLEDSEDSMFIFHVTAENAPAGQINVTLTVSGETMTGTAWGHTCATLKLQQSKT